MARIGFFGSRKCSGAGNGFLFRATERFASAGREICTGCATGGDAACIAGALAAGAGSALHVFTIMDQYWRGSWRDTAVGAVKEAKQAGATIHYEAGGPLSMHLVDRLRGRSRAMVKYTGGAADPRSGIVGAIAMPWPVGSFGSWGTVALGWGLGLNVLVFPDGITAIAFRTLGRGFWKPTTAKGFEGCYVWVFAKE